MSESENGGLVVPFLIKLVVNIAMVWVMAAYLPAYFVFSGGVSGYILIGLLITLMNVLVRPVLNILTAPLKLIAALLAVIVVNGAIVYATVLIISKMESNLVSLGIGGGFAGWLAVALAFGFGNWLLRAVLK